jgi:shikimate kinase
MGNITGVTNSTQVIVFIGPMGSGKTTIGRRVARALKLDFVDCDRELEKRTGVDVARIFDVEGEAGFRKRETLLLGELCARQNLLIATGGGVVMTPENCKILQQRGFVVYLETQVEQQLNRLYRDSQRPLLQTPDRRKRLNALAAVRSPLYQSLADITIESGSRSLTNMAAKVTRNIQRSWQAGHGSDTGPDPR